MLMVSMEETLYRVSHFKLSMGSMPDTVIIVSVASILPGLPVAFRFGGIA